MKSYLCCSREEFSQRASVAQPTAHPAIKPEHCTSLWEHCRYSPSNAGSVRAARQEAEHDPCFIPATERPRGFLLHGPHRPLIQQVRCLTGFPQTSVCVCRQLKRLVGAGGSITGCKQCEEKEEARERGRNIQADHGRKSPR